MLVQETDFRSVCLLFPLSDTRSEESHQAEQAGQEQKPRLWQGTQGACFRIVNCVIRPADQSLTNTEAPWVWYNYYRNTFMSHTIYILFTLHNISFLDPFVS